MKTRLSLLGIALSAFLSACYVTPPGVPLTDVPAEPFVRSLEQRRASFLGMKAVARVETEHRGRKRAYESVAVILQGHRKLRVEGYGPLGETVFTLVWDGTDVLVKRAGEGTVHKAGQFGFERMLGVSLSPSDLCAILSGNIPALPVDAETTARCSQAGWCVVDYRHAEQHWRVKVRPVQDRTLIEQIELLRGGKEVLSASYGYPDGVPLPDLPSTVVLAQKDRSASLLVQYQDAEVNVPVEDSLFVLPPEEAGR